MNEITKEEFQAFEDVRAGGGFNMFSLDARESTGLSKEKYTTIMKNYTELCKKWPDVRNLS
jgi:hypothetical protein